MKHFGKFESILDIRNDLCLTRSQVPSLPVAAIMPPHRREGERAASSKNFVDNNHIFDGGHVYAGGVGVWVAQSSHNVISHNEIHDFFYSDSGTSLGVGTRRPKIRP